jgi:Tol biopolymer transport system component
MQVKRVSHVRVSPDGKHVVFVVAQAVMESEKSEWVSQIYLAASDGGGAVQLTQGEKGATSPEWSPDGQWIVFLSARGAKAESKSNLWRIRVAGGEAEQLTDGRSDISRYAGLQTGPRSLSVWLSRQPRKRKRQRKKSATGALWIRT